ncbi:hypothetical protein [Amycolatopsis sp. NPDC051071]|uniref:hypothetical protein n=1 Tax=Amycolatopsis sp. NPDC051071 TaxID=3154637 RepID=UPI00342D9D37
MVSTKLRIEWSEPPDHWWGRPARRPPRTRSTTSRYASPLCLIVRARLSRGCRGRDMRGQIRGAVLVADEPAHRGRR